MTTTSQDFDVKRSIAVDRYLHGRFEKSFAHLMRMAISRGLCYRNYEHLEVHEVLELQLMLFGYDRTLFSLNLEKILALVRHSEQWNSEGLILSIDTSGLNGLMMHPLRCQTAGWLHLAKWREFLTALAWAEDFQGTNLAGLGLKSRLDIIYKAAKGLAAEQAISTIIQAAPGLKTARTRDAKTSLLRKLQEINVGPTAFGSYLANNQISLEDFVGRRAMGDPGTSNIEVEALVNSYREEFMSFRHSSNPKRSFKLWGDQAFRFGAWDLKVTIERYLVLADSNDPLMRSIRNALDNVGFAQDDEFAAFLERVDVEYDLLILAPRRQLASDLLAREALRVADLKAYYAQGGRGSSEGRTGIEDRNPTQDV